MIQQTPMPNYNRLAQRARALIAELHAACDAAPPGPDRTEADRCLKAAHAHLDKALNVAFRAGLVTTKVGGIPKEGP